MMVLAPGELKEVRGHRFSIADFRSALVSQVSPLAPRCCWRFNGDWAALGFHWLFSRKKLKR
jgi:hypothetical protein